MRRCLIVSPHFPPSTLAGVHRARHLAKHLPAHGWEPTVICVDPRHHLERLDPELAGLVPRTAKIVATQAVPAAITRPFGVAGDVGLRGFFYLRAAIARSMGERKADAVLITGSPFYPMLLSSWIRRRWNVPVVLDFQDPWVSNEGAKRKRWSKGWLAHRLARRFEPTAVSGAAWITSVSDVQNQELAARHPDFDALRMTTIPIGGDPEDFATLRNAAPVPAGERFVFSYVGTALPRATELFRVLFRAAAGLRADHPALADRVRFRFVGTSNQPDGRGGARVRELAASEGVADLVCEEPARVPFLEALRTLSTTDAILMVGSDEPHYTASKIYPCLMAGRPFLSLFHAESSAHRILAAAGGGIALAFRSSDELSALAPKLTSALERIVTAPSSLGSVDPAAYASYTAHAVAGDFARVFEAVCVDGGPYQRGGQAVAGGTFEEVP